MTVVLRPEPTYDDCLTVARNLRARDWDELSATKYKPTPEAIAHDAFHCGRFRWGAYKDGRPIALAGAVPRWPGVWTAWAYGTDEWPAAVGLLSRHVRRFMLPALFNAGAHRVDAFALADHDDARKWLRFLGANHEETLAGWGKNGESFVCHVWTRKTTKRQIDKIERRRQNAQG